MLGASRAVTQNPATPPAPLTEGRLWVAAVSFILPFALWLGLLLALQVPGMIGKTPLDVFTYLSPSFRPM